MGKENLKDILLCAKNNFPQEFKNMVPCVKSNEHDWFVNQINNQTKIRLLDVECKNCKTNLVIALKFFTGIQDHG